MKRTLLGACCVVLTIGAAWVVAQEKAPVGDAKQKAESATLEQKYSYALGLDMATNFSTRKIKLDVESLVAGIEAGLSGAESRFDRATCRSVLLILQAKMSSKGMPQEQADTIGNLQLGNEFLAENRTKEGVQVTESGLQYKVLVAGKGAKSGPNDTIRCNYRGTLIDGREFDANKGFEFNVAGGVIEGWLEAGKLMRVGDKWQLYVPAHLAYSNQQRGPMIAPGSTLLFELEVTGIVGK